MPVIKAEAFMYLSSELDWCEPNFIWSFYIAEFFNTISNIPLILFNILQFKLYGSYIKNTNHQGLVATILVMVVVGAGSAYFHGTLSFAGQLVDELGILWAIAMISINFWPETNNPMIPRFYIKAGILAITILCTFLSATYPKFNQYALILLGIPFLSNIFLMYIKLEKNDAIFKELLQRFLFFYVTAFTVWTLDKVLCDLWLQLQIPYFHAIWHVLCSYFFVAGLALSIYMHSLSKGQSKLFQLGNYPEFAGFFGLPYLKHKEHN